MALLNVVTCCFASSNILQLEILTEVDVHTVVCASRRMIPSTVVAGCSSHYMAWYTNMAKYSVFIGVSTVTTLIPLIS